MLRAVAISAAVLLPLTTLFDTSPTSAVIAVAVAFAPATPLGRPWLRRGGRKPSASSSHFLRLLRLPSH